MVHRFRGTFADVYRLDMAPLAVTVESVKVKFGIPDPKHVMILVVTGIQGGGHIKCIDPTRKNCFILTLLPMKTKLGCPRIARYA